MKAKTLSFVAGTALAANVGLAQAVNLDEMPEILSAVAVHEITLIMGDEMEAIQSVPPVVKITGESKFKVVDSLIKKRLIGSVP